MIYYTVYLPNGDITRTGVCPTDDMALQAGPGELVMEGYCASTDTQYVSNGKIVDLPLKPTDTDYPEFYSFDYSLSSWVFDSVGAAAAALSDMDTRLQDGPDRISPIWWDAMSAETKAVWTQYRLDLLAVSSQPTFPKRITWPVKPTVGT